MLKQATIAQETKEGFLLFVPCAGEEREKIKSVYYPQVVVEFVDKKLISPAQRRNAYRLLQAIALWYGGTPSEVAKEITKMIFHGDNDATTRWFSLSNCSMEIARKYITFLIDFCLLHGVPCGEPLYKLAEDIPRYVRHCLLQKTCAVCGRKGELHHADSVGTGRNRKEICHIGMQALPLCRKHHTEVHTIGRESFLKKYILEPVAIDERIAKVYKLKG